MGHMRAVLSSICLLSLLTVMFGVVSADGTSDRVAAGNVETFSSPSGTSSSKDLDLTLSASIVLKSGSIKVSAPGELIIDGLEDYARAAIRKPELGRGRFTGATLSASESASLRTAVLEGGFFTLRVGAVQASLPACLLAASDYQVCGREYSLCVTGLD
jgi:hypothetical protein